MPADAKAVRETLKRTWAAAVVALAVFVPGSVARAVGTGAGSRPARACHPAAPAGQRTLYGTVLWKDTDRNGMFQDFQLMANGVSYTVITNFYDGRAALTKVINLACRQSPVQFIQVANFVYVTGRMGSAMSGSKRRPVIHASVVQVLTSKDRGA